MRTLANPHTAQIIPFPRLVARTQRYNSNGHGMPQREPPTPTIEWGGAHYHDAAIVADKIAANKGAPRS